jgi:hypothetical protein
MTHRRTVLKAAGAAVAASGPVAALARRAAPGAVIDTDICIVGGGAAGTYTAVRLNDLGLRVLVVERAARLGGHAQTYVDPGTGTPDDVGVVAYEDSTLARNYLDRFGIAYSSAQFPRTKTVYVDMRSGLPVPGYRMPLPAADLLRYRSLLARRYPFLDKGFALPDPVPAELLEPFGNFVTRHRLQRFVPIVFEFGQGIGDLLATPTLYVLKLFSLTVADAVFGAGFLFLPGGTAQLYDAAGAWLGPQVLLNSSVTAAVRSADGVQLQLDTPAGASSVRCRKLVITIPPLLANLAPFDLDANETSLFGRFKGACYGTAVVELAGIDDNLSLQNMAADTPYNLPPLPAIYGVTPVPGAPGLWNVKYGSATPMADADIRQAIQAQIERVAAAGTLPVEFRNFRYFGNHTPFQVRVDAGDIAAGFYAQLAALQGGRNTFFNGAAFQTNNSALIWQFTEQLLPRIVA